MEGPQKIKNELSYDLLIQFLITYPKEIKSVSQRAICMPVLTAALFMIADTWRQPMCPWTNEWIMKMWTIIQPWKRRKSCHLWQQDEPGWHYAKWNKPDTERHLYVESKKNPTNLVESGMVVTSGWEWRSKEMPIKGYRLSLENEPALGSWCTAWVWWVCKLIRLWPSLHKEHICQAITLCTLNIYSHYLSVKLEKNTYYRNIFKLSGSLGHNKWVRNWSIFENTLRQMKDWLKT